MEIEVEIILEAAEIISKFPKDVTVLREQQKILNFRIEELIAAAQPRVQPTVATEPLEDSPWQTGARRGAVIPSNRNSG